MEYTGKTPEEIKSFCENVESDKQSEQELIKISESFRSINRLYHFTKHETAIEILKSGGLRYSKLNRMNDMHESSKLIYVEYSPAKDDSDDKSKQIDVVHNEIYNYRQISLTEDKEDSLGFNLMQQWGLYADCFNGVCLVFDKVKLSRYFNKQNIKDNKARKSVKYMKHVDSSEISKVKNNAEDIQKEIFSLKNKIFFQKRYEWEHEQEYRFIKRCSDDTRQEYLFFHDALKFIIISNALVNNHDEDSDISKREEELKNAIANFISREKPVNYNIPILYYSVGLNGYGLSYNYIGSIWHEDNGFEVNNE